MQPSISWMNSSGETGGMMIMFCFSIFSRAFPPACRPALSRASFGIRTLPLWSILTSCVVIFPTNNIPTVGNLRLAGVVMRFLVENFVFL